MDFIVKPMTDEQRKSMALELMSRIDRGEDVLDLFDASARVHFPKWGLASGREEIQQLFGDIGKVIGSITHHHAHFNVVVKDDLVVVEGTSHGTTTDGIEWRAGVTFAGLWCDVLEIRDFKIHRLYIYLDPDYWDADTARYPWLASRIPSKRRDTSPSLGKAHK
jgi:ketosteroid isomerase-like protein